MIENEADLPDDIPSLKSLVLDLSRRLQNAQHTIEAERKTTQLALQQAADYRLRLSETVQSFRLESARIRNTDFKLTRQQEAKKFEENKGKGTQLYDKVKLAELDHQMTGLTRTVPLKLSKLRNQLKLFDDQQSNLKTLLQHFSEIDETNDLFMNCVQHNQIEDCIQLLNQGVDVNYIDSAGYLALHYACSQGYYEIAQLLLQAGSDHSAYLTGYAPIILAAKHGYINIIRLLLEFGADIEEKGKLNMPALIAAVECQQFSTVEFLISQGADIHAYDFHENTMLHTLCKLPTSNQNGHSRTINATATNNINANAIGNFLVYCLELGLDVQRVNRTNNTPLQVALYAKNHLAIQLLNEWFVQHPELQGNQLVQEAATESGNLNNTNTNSNGTMKRSVLNTISGTKSSSQLLSSSASSSSVSNRPRKFLPSHLTSRQAIFTSRGGKVPPQPLPTRLPITRTSIINNSNNSKMQQSPQQKKEKEKVHSDDSLVEDHQIEAGQQEVMMMGGALLEEDDDPLIQVTSAGLQVTHKEENHDVPFATTNHPLATQSVASSVTFDYA